MAKVAIDGLFTEKRMQGIVRYATELVKALDAIVGPSDDIVLVVPSSAKDVPSLRNIRVVRTGARSGIAWEQVDFARYLRKEGVATTVNLCNTAPFFSKPGITAIHDVMYKANPSHYTTLRNKISRIWHMVQYCFLVRHERVILTVSEFSKGEIERYYPKAQGKIRVIPNGWQHVLAYCENPAWQEAYPFAEPGEYYFSMATLARNKNGAWILGAARRNPESLFLVAGKSYESEYVDVPENVRLLGFVSDEDACSLIKHCKAFIFPSLYEGFGLPPLEALALGAPVIASDATSIPEVLGDAAHYIDPLDFDVDLDELLAQPVDAPGTALSRFSWDASAERLLEAIREHAI